ncbi:hypothetical protein [Devosia faecipullorum]|uniref:hypothetical protein n=1 Tax=Devosia faecipullorum TaxID=2755039 RepID=UPI00187BB826|nr:hypothetical protein [Devosia faecipullorum]MBE7733810.1 hypothetical protein [Devosia faecipullorum]
MRERSNWAPRARTGKGPVLAILGALGNEDASDLEVHQVVAIFNRYDTLRRTLDKAQDHASAAIAALAALPDSEMKTILAEVVDHSVGRAS